MRGIDCRLVGNRFEVFGKQPDKLVLLLRNVPINLKKPVFKEKRLNRSLGINFDLDL